MLGDNPESKIFFSFVSIKIILKKEKESKEKQTWTEKITQWITCLLYKHEGLSLHFQHSQKSQVFPWVSVTPVTGVEPVRHQGLAGS